MPDPLTGLPLAIDSELAAALAGAGRSIRRLTAGPGAGDLDGLLRPAAFDGDGLDART